MSSDAVDATPYVAPKKGSDVLRKELEKRGIRDAREYAKKYNRPGIGTVERYIDGSQDPITTTGSWRSAPLRIAQQMGVDIETLFPEAAEERQKILDELSNSDSENGQVMTIYPTVLCPKTATDGNRPIFVLVDNSCVHCPMKLELTPARLVCGHPKAKDM